MEQQDERVPACRYGCVKGAYGRAGDLYAAQPDEGERPRHVRPRNVPPGFENNQALLAEHVSFLASNAVSTDLKLRQTCADQFRALMEDFLAGIRFDHDLEDYVTTQGSGGCQTVQVDPDIDGGYTESYLAKFELLGDEGDDGDSDGGDGDGGDVDFFVDPSFLGSLVWPVRFRAQRGQVTMPIHNANVALNAEMIGSCLTKGWFEKFLNYLRMQEASEDQTAEAPSIESANVKLLTRLLEK